MYQHKNGRWYIDAWVKRPGAAKSERLHKSLGTTNKREARALEVQWIKEAEDGTLAGSPNLQPPFERRWPSLDALEAADRQRMVARYGSRPEIVESGLGYEWKRVRMFYSCVSEMTTASLTAYQRFHEDRGIKSKTYKRDFFVIKRAVEEARRTHPTLAPIGELPRVPKSTPGKNRGRMIPLPNLKAWLAQLSSEARAKALIFLFTGLRAEEFARIEVEDIERTSEHEGISAFIRLPDHKAKWHRGRTLALTERAYRALLLALPTMGSNPKKAFNGAAARAGLQPICRRDLRHTFGTLIGKHDILAVAYAMGHKPSITAVGHIYQHFDDQRMAQVARWVEDALFGDSPK